ncbi:hypothetical protein [Dapis sp. BLCC M172]|uniref:hypothetical protein n=1 Tax=Dapis sp. BLCC M172 TaxID=2975281 RepID=UPI003CFAAB18
MSTQKTQHQAKDLQTLSYLESTEPLPTTPNSLSPLSTPLRSELSSSSSDFDSMFAKDPRFAIRFLREYADNHGEEGIRCLEARKGVGSREIGLHEDARIMKLSEEEFIVL